jgi:hypothetical protein
MAVEEGIGDCRKDKDNGLKGDKNLSIAMAEGKKG